MAKKKTRTGKVKSAVTRTRQTKTARRKMRAAAGAKPKVKTKAVKAAPKPESQQTSAGSNRAEGIRLFKLAGRPSKEEFIQVFGENGPRMTWQERAAAGVPAEKFQEALASAARGKK